MTDMFPIEIARLRRSASEAVLVKLAQYMGTPLIEVRSYWLGHDGSCNPSRKGLSLSVKHLPALAKALAQAETKARSMGLLDT